MTKLCIYHHNCADGFGAAWVVRKKFGEDCVDFYPGKYQEPPPCVRDRDVILVDFSYKKDVIIEMLKTAKSITIIDHHKSAIEDLKPLEEISSIGMDLREPLYLCFDTNHSGAMLAWLYYFGKEKPPELLRHIEDRDLWKFDLPYTREIQAAVFSYPYDFKVWDQLMASKTDRLIAEGVAIERKHHKDVAELVTAFKRRMIIAGHNVPVASLPYTLSSDAGHMMAKGEAFAACYFDTDGYRNFSLRSTDAGADVSEVAKQYGGGGHRNAAGFKVPLSEIQQFEVQS